MGTSRHSNDARTFPPFDVVEHGSRLLGVLVLQHRSADLLSKFAQRENDIKALRLSTIQGMWGAATTLVSGNLPRGHSETEAIRQGAAPLYVA